MSLLVCKNNSQSSETKAHQSDLQPNICLIVTENDSTGGQCCDFLHRTHEYLFVCSLFSHDIHYSQVLIHTNQKNGMEGPKISPYIQGQLIFDKSTTTIQWGVRIVFPTAVLGQLAVHMQRMKLNLHHIPYTKINSK
jgi:hypothetical protein